MSAERAKALEERLANLGTLLSKELAGSKSETYIADLNDSIAGCERELKFYKKNPSGVEFVNGG